MFKIALLFFATTCCLRGELPSVDRSFYFGRWYSKPVFVEFYQHDLYIEVDVSKSGSIKFSSLVIKDRGDKLSPVGILLERHGDYQFSNGGIDFSNTDMGGSVRIEKIDGNSIRIRYPQEGVPPDILFKESEAPWSKRKILKEFSE